MAEKIRKLLKKIRLKRTTVMLLVFCAMFAVLIQRLFSLQIIHGEEYAENFNLSITKERTLKGTRGNIRDRNGELLAYNELSYSVILEDNGTYDTTRQRNLTLNHVAYELLKILEKRDEKLDITFYIELDEQGNYAFTAQGFTLNRFKADVYGEPLIDDLKEDQINATAEEIMEFMSGEKDFAVVNREKPYTQEELEAYGLPESLTKQELLDIVKIRYILSTNSFRKYVPVTIATDVSEETVAEIMERKDELQGVDIQEDSIRVYADAEAFSSLIGYTGKADSEELADLREQGYEYSTDAIIGKTGIEQLMETQLQGKDGSETVFVDNVGKILDIDEDSRKDPEAGNDVYLTIDKNLQKVAYDVLEQTIAGVLVQNIVNTKEFETNSEDTSDVRTPIYDVYNALIENGVLDISHFKEDDATDLEKTLYSLFQQKQESVFAQIKEELTKEAPAAYKDLPEEMQEYQSYIVNDFLTSQTGILSEDAIDSTDSTYRAWTDDSSISMKEYLTYAASKNWIDISSFTDEGEYLSSSEVYDALSNYLTESLQDDKGFSKILYKYMLLTDTISGTQLCLLLYDQGVLEPDEATYSALSSGTLRAYDFMINKISNLEITPGQLALDPCSGSVVITDVKTGETLACVSYPGYDNNRLANNMDTEYYAHLYEDMSRPFYNKATQHLTAPGSTFKPLTAIAGLEEGIVNSNYIVNCTGRFDLISNGPYCWNRSGHGALDVVGGITNSCNVFFSQVAYDLGKDADGNFNDSLGVEKLEKYANLFRLNEKSGLEIEEASPRVSDADAIRTSFGQSTHNYTTSQLARYVTTIASRGTSYELSLFDKVTDEEGNIVEDYTPQIKGELDISGNTWDLVQAGMRGVARNNATLNSINLSVAGKTGTAQQETTRPSHGLFIGFAPYEDPEIAMAVRIANGYSSGNAVTVAKDILLYRYNLADESEIVTGTAETEVTNTQQTD